MLKLLNECLEEAEIYIENENKERLIEFVKILDKWNKAYNLTSIRDPKEMIIRHIMDSLVISKYLEGNSFIDVGSGPGIPGIPLAIVNKDKKFILLDSLGKRIIFQKNAKLLLSIDNIESVEARVENFTPSFKIDGVLSRAFTATQNMLKLTDHLINKGKHFYALKGKITKEDVELSSKYELIDIFALSVPKLNETRHLLKIKKL